MILGNFEFSKTSNCSLLLFLYDTIDRCIWPDQIPVPVQNYIFYLPESLLLAPLSPFVLPLLLSLLLESLLLSLLLLLLLWLLPRVLPNPKFRISFHQSLLVKSSTNYLIDMIRRLFIAFRRIDIKHTCTCNNGCPSDQMMMTALYMCCLG